MSDNKSDVQRFYDAVAAKFGVQRKYHELHPTEQMQLVQARKMLIYEI